jgi:ABC-2 type transport system permease protein
MSTILALAVKDLRVLSRVKVGLFFTFVWPLIVSILFGLVFSGQSREGGPGPLRIAVADEDDSEASRAYLQRLTQSGEFSLQAASRADADAMVRRGEQAAFVVLARGFGEASGRMFYGPPRRIEIGIDPSRQAEAGMIEGLLTKHAMQDVQRLFTESGSSRQMVGRALEEVRKAPGSELAPTTRFLEELDRYLAAPQPAVPGGGPAAWSPLEVTRTSVARQPSGPTNAFAVTFPQGVVWGIIGCVMTFAIGLVSERVRGTFVRLQMAPLTRTTILAGKAVACFASIVVLQIVLFAVAVAIFGVRPGSTGLLVIAGLAAATAFVGFMMMVAGLGRTEHAVSGTGWALLMPMTLFGGGMIPQFVMPGWMLAVGHASPVKWAIRAFEGAIWRGFTPAEMLLPCGILVGFGLLCFAVGVRGLRD